jgi:beta-phosphoglucomutase-like phosphatase (HAD superfamily)
MVLKAVLFNLNGVIINDESIHKRLIDELLLEENIIARKDDYKKYCLGIGDLGLKDLLYSHGRVLEQKYFDNLLERKARAYRENLLQLGSIPSYVGLKELFEEIKSRSIYLGMISGTLTSEANLVLEQLKYREFFDIIVGAEELEEPRPDPKGHLLALEKFNTLFKEKVTPLDILAIESTPVGIAAAKKANIQVIGVANIYPFHFMQRMANWAVDSLADLELDRLESFFESSQK